MGSRFFVSMPRCGQHMHERLFREIYAYYNINYSYCEHYSCCNEVPCVRGCLFQKNHDFGLDLEIADDSAYLVLYRSDKAAQIEAQFRFSVWEQRGRKRGVDGLPDTRLAYTKTEVDDLKEFAKRQSVYYEHFMAKWVALRRGNVLPIEYSTYISDPVGVACEILDFFGDIEVDRVHLSSFMKARPEKIVRRSCISSEIRELINSCL